MWNFLCFLHNDKYNALADNPLSDKRYWTWTNAVTSSLNELDPVTPKKVQKDTMWNFLCFLTTLWDKYNLCDAYFDERCWI